MAECDRREKPMQKRKVDDFAILRMMVWAYIILCVVIAGLNYGYVQVAPEPVAQLITAAWHFYENWVKMAFIVTGSILTLRIVKRTSRTDTRKKNLIGFIIAALVVHIVSPLILGNKELYFFAMPLPWTTTPLQLLYEDSSFYASRFPIWGATGITWAVIFYVAISVVIFGGTLLFGRRWQCSRLCLFNGFASEVFAPAFPLIGKKRQLSPSVLKVFRVAKWTIFAIAIFFLAYWVLLLLGFQVFEDYQTISRLEVYKYLSAELLGMMFFWIVLTGRGYCYYCPLGTVLGYMGKLSGQRIVTDQTRCIGCNQCNIACPMTIDIRGKALAGEPVISMNCVGCGHCVDVCFTKMLSYTTCFLGKTSKICR